MYGAGLANITALSGQREINAARDGALLDTMSGTNDEREKYKSLIDLRKDEPVVFKGLALNEDWYNPDFYAGIQFDDPNKVNWDPERQRGGAAVNPLSTAWSLGWTNAKADFGAALDALGVATGSEWLSTVGREQRVNAGKKLAETGFLNVQQLSDIRGDGFLNTAIDTLEWLM